MSKSRGNVVTPLGLLEQHGSDAVRYWAAAGRPGADTAFDVSQMKIGRRLTIKILNVSRFVLGIGTTGGRSMVTEPLDRGMLAELADVADEATEALESYDYTRALERVERFFWFFCDNYVELVKSRAYGERGAAGAESARAALGVALSALLRLFAPFLPFTAEEVWSWWQEGSIHRADWPAADGLRRAAAQTDARVLEVASGVIGAIRAAKSQAKLSLRAQVRKVTVIGGQDTLDLFRSVSTEVASAGQVAEVELCVSDGQELVTQVTL